MSHFATIVTVLKTLTLVLGGLITLYAYRAYRRTGAPPLRYLAVGFGTVTVGALLAGVVDQFVPVGPNVALATESLFTTAGFAIILYSLYAD